MMPSLPRHQRKSRAGVFFGQQLGHADCVSTFLRFETTRAFAGNSRRRGLPRSGFASAKEPAVMYMSRKNC
jgi:hypothetical protein